ncbi:MAG: S8 family peptidase [Flavobacteriales bacterium]|nr:S8 family peptidase [Flavobacteriales bacterium]MBP6697719.1 S8 family peptidase [Flavobacteriales bacterium]
MRSLITLLFLALLVVPNFAQRPQPFGLQLEYFLKRPHMANEEVDLLLRGDARILADAVKQVEGRVKMTMADRVSATVPVARVLELAQCPALQGIEFSMDRGRTMNDSMRVRNRVDLVHSGMPPLLQGYTGDGVVIGIIDTGLELLHPDFQDSLGNTRVLHYWDQTLNDSLPLAPLPYGYGQEYDSAAINAGLCPAVDPWYEYGHGSTVAGTAAGNGLANGRHKGVAPDADLIVVTSDFGRPNWRASVADAVKYIFDHAAALGQPAVINASLGDYYGSHDGLDASALMIDSMLEAAPGRAMVCASGNSGSIPNYHLSYPVTSDTGFTWFSTNYVSGFGFPCVYFELWADTADFEQVHFSIGADLFTANGVPHRGDVPYRTVQDALGQLLEDTLYSIDGNRLAVVNYYAELRGGQYRMDVMLAEPDSDTYKFRFSTTGFGQFDVWTSSYLGTSEIFSDLGVLAGFSDSAHYRLPDTEKRVVDSWACSEKVITVGNYRNQISYTDHTNTLQTFTGTPGELVTTSSGGPTRDNRLKPDIAATGDITLSSAPLEWLNLLIANDPAKVDVGGYHIRSGGTSIASPVVTGTVALLFERCPNATWADAKEAILAAARADNFTGTAPNNLWGHGKLDAFGALLAAGPDMTFAVDTTICDGDSVLVTAPADLIDYTWNTGLQNAPFYQSTNGQYSIAGTNDAGCFGYSDTITFVKLPLPLAPVITQLGNTLESTPAATYQWWMNGTPINGADQQTYDVYVTGTYAVSITDAEGCGAMSDTLFVLSTGFAEPSASDMRIWPVPASNELHVQWPANIPAVHVTLEVNDAQGRLIARGRAVTTREFVLDVNGWASGLYTLRIQSDGSSRAVRFSVR